MTFSISALSCCSHTIVIGVDPSAPAGSTHGIRANVAATGVTFPGQIAALITSSPPGQIAITNNFLNVAVPVPGAPTLTEDGTSTVEGPLLCTSTSTVVLTNPQGTAELMGSIILSCTESGGAPAITDGSITVSLSPVAAVVTNDPLVLPTISIDHAAGVTGTISGNTVAFPVITPACSGPAACSHTIVIGVDPSAPAGSTIGIRANVVATGVTLPAQIAALILGSPVGVIADANNFINIAIPLPGTPTTTGDGTSTVEGQLSCTAFSVPTLVRSQGIAEWTGSMVLNCTASGGALAISGASISVLLLPTAAAITNAPGVPPTLTLDQGAPVAGSVSGNAVTFTVPAISACAGPASCSHTITIGIRPDVANSVEIRANVFATGLTFPSQLAAFITTSPVGVIAVTNNFLNVAIPQPGLSTSTSFQAGAAISQCTAPLLGGVPSSVAYQGGTGAAAFTATDPISGLTGILPASVPTVTSVEGYPLSWAVAGANGEGSDSTQGTRLLFKLGSFPINAIVVAPNYVTTAGTLSSGDLSSNTILALVPGADANGAGGGSPVFPTVGALGGATVISGTTVTYEVIKATSFIAESIVVPFGVYTTGTPSAAAATVSVEMAPVSAVGTPVASPIPRFGDQSFSGSLVTVNACPPTAPAITSPNNGTFTEGVPGAFTVTATGFPSPTFTETGPLPGGVTLSAGGVLSGTPAANTGGNSFQMTIKASNGVLPDATQDFTLTIILRKRRGQLVSE